jgi:hypothetical protein
VDPIERLRALRKPKDGRTFDDIIFAFLKYEEVEKGWSKRHAIRQYLIWRKDVSPIIGNRDVWSYQRYWKQALEPLIASRRIKRGMEARSMVERALGLAGYNGCNEARWNRLFKSNKTLVSKNERFDLLRAFQ